MPSRSKFLFDNVSVVIVTTTNDSSYLNPDFLKFNKIVPSKWKVTEAVSTPILSIARYDNGLGIQVERNRLKVDQNLPNDKFIPQYLFPSVTKKLIGKIPLANPTGVGLNCNAFYLCQHPRRFLIDKFLAPDFRKRKKAPLMQANLMLTFDMKSAFLQLKMEPRTIEHKTTKVKHEVVAIDCNFHHNGPFSKSKIEAILGTWGARQNELEKLLKALMRKK